MVSATAFFYYLMGDEHKLTIMSKFEMYEDRG